jgi:hypothetical protein
MTTQAWGRTEAYNNIHELVRVCCTPSTSFLDRDERLEIVDDILHHTISLTKGDISDDVLLSYEAKIRCLKGIRRCIHDYEGDEE